MKNLKVIWPTVLAFLLIGTLNSCQDYQVSHKTKEAEKITLKIENIDFDKIFLKAQPEENEKTRTK